MNEEDLEKEVREILQTPFNGICTSSGVFSGYQLSHQVGGQFAYLIISVCKPLIEKAERERILKLLPDIPIKFDHNRTCFDCIEGIKRQARIGEK